MKIKVADDAIVGLVAGMGVGIFLAVVLALLVKRYLL